MNNNLPTRKTPYSSSIQAKETQLWIYVLRGACSLAILIAWLVYYRQKNADNKSKFEELAEEKKIDKLTIKSLQRQIKDYREQQSAKPELIAEQTKKLIKTGNRLKLEENKTCEGNYDVLSNFFSSGGW